MYQDCSVLDVPMQKFLFDCPKTYWDTLHILLFSLVIS